MIERTNRTNFGIFGLLLMLSAAHPAMAETAHSDAISCYAYVHSQCYGNGENNCSQADYEWGLDQCDGYYPSKGVVRPKAPSGLTTQATSPRTKAMIESSFKTR